MTIYTLYYIVLNFLLYTVLNYNTAIFRIAYSIIGYCLDAEVAWRVCYVREVVV